MTVTIPDLIGSYADAPRPRACPATHFVAPVLTITVNDQAVLSISRRLHDGTCLHGNDCGLRDFHAMDVYETDVRVMLAAMVQASTDAESPEISPCGSVTARRWFRGKWWCTACGKGIRFGSGIGWVHTP